MYIDTMQTAYVGNLVTILISHAKLLTMTNFRKMLAIAEQHGIEAKLLSPDEVKHL